MHSLKDLRQTFKIFSGLKNMCILAIYLFSDEKEDRGRREHKFQPESLTPYVKQTNISES